MAARCTIVIPTLAARPRELDRAIASVLAQRDHDAVPLVVVNGDRYDTCLLDQLRQRRDIRFHQIAEPGVSGARHEGMQMVDTPFYGFLDDDDEYLPDGLAIRRREFSLRPDIDVVVGNGWLSVHGNRQLLWTDTEAIAADPADALMWVNWLGACGALFRTDAVGPEFFDLDLEYFEWTYLALHLALSCKLAFTSEPTFIYHDTPGSVSDSDSYREAQSMVLKRMLNFEMPGALRVKLREKRSAADHNLAEHYRAGGMHSKAWKWHLRSMRGMRGLMRYGAYTRKLLTIPGNN